MSGAPVDALACPICGGANACGPAQRGSFAGPCWCASVSFDAKLLARVPVALRGTSCICPACAGAASAPEAKARSAS